MKEKEYIIKIPIKEFIRKLHLFGIIESMFVENSKYKYLTNDEYSKLFNRDNEISVEFFEGLNNDILCEIDHVCIKTKQKIIRKKL